MASGLFTLKQQVQALRQGAWNGQKTKAVEYLVVAGGGGGGAQSGGGGGAGGLLTGITPVTAGSSITVTVGAAGTGTAYNGNPTYGGNGSNSVFNAITAIGGGGGGADGATNNYYAPSGGSGGGGGMRSGIGGQGIAGQGNAGGSSQNQVYASGGGGGAGSKGLDQIYSSTAGYNGPGNGGSGVASVISGVTTAYAGGGGGGVWSGTGNFGPALGGAGGGGIGARGDAISLATAGTANTGGGGGGGSSSTSNSYSSGANGGSGIVILSYPDVYPAAASTTGSPTVSTSGSGSINCAGSSACLYYGGQSGFAFGTGDFTLEMWLNPNTTAQNEFYDCRPSGGGAGTQYPVLYANAGKIFFFSNGVDLITGTTTLTTGTWYHIAVCRSGTSTKMFLNGVQEGSTYTDTNNYAVGSSRPVVMGSGSGSPGGTVFNGKISNLRVVKGTALYTSAFTPSTAPLTAVTNTQLLLNSISGAYLVDSSTNSFAASVAGAPAWNSASPFTVTGYKNRVYTWTSSGSITF